MVCAALSPGGTTPFGHPRWATRLCLARYRYLAWFYPPKEIKPRPPHNPAFRQLWDRWKAAEKAAERAKKRFDEAASAGRRKLPAQKRLGRRGNILFRETTKALTRLYSEIYGIKATHTTRGPAARFAAAFFDGLDGKWGWISADDFEQTFNGAGNLLIWSLLAPIDVPTPSALPDLLRAAIVDAEQEAVTDRVELPTATHVDERCPVPGAFALTEMWGEKWGTFDGEMPEIFRLTRK